MDQQPDVSYISLKINGADPPPEAIGDLVEVTVDHSLHLPSAFTLRLYSHEMQWLDDPTFQEGQKVEIYAGEHPPVKLLSGKIAALEPDLDEGNPAIVVRGFDLSHQLYRGRQRRSFNQVTDSDLARQLAGEAGLQPGTIDSTSEVYDYLYQNNQTNAEFLLQRARRLGFELWVDDDQMNFRQPSPAGSPIELAWGDTLRSFRTRLSTAAQVNEVEVRGWDPTQKQEVVGHAQNGNGGPQIGLTQSGADTAKQVWGEAKLAVVDQYVRSPSEADTLAQATLDAIAASYVEAEGTCNANPAIVPGCQVEIKGVGQRFSGTYYVTRVLHEWSTGHGLVTHFTMSGRRDRGLWSLIEEAAPRPIGMGLVIGIVTNNRDPDELGRVRVKFPWLSDGDESAWARLLSPMAGAGRGLLTLPEVDDEVVVGFEHGDIHRPFVVGGLWNGKDQLPMNASDAVGGDGKVNKRVFKSRSGHTITLDDTDGDEQITIVDKTGNNSITFNSSDNSMQIKVQGDLTIESQGKISMSGANGVDVSTQQSLTLSGQTGAELSTQQKLTMSGQTGADLSTQAQLTLSGQTSAQLSSQAQVSVSGAMVSVQGQGPVSVQGTPIQLN